jgi:hypothetical protein
VAEKTKTGTLKEFIEQNLKLATIFVKGVMSASDKEKLDGVAANATNYTHPDNHPPTIITQDTSNRFVADSDITNWNGKISSSEKGSANGVATLDGASKVPANQLPSYVDDVLEYANLVTFPATGETGKIYVALDNNKTYRWSGSVYIYITSGAVDSVAGKTGVVTLVKSDVGLGNVDNTADSVKNVLHAETADSATPTAHGSAAHSGMIGTKSQISDFPVSFPPTAHGSAAHSGPIGALSQLSDFPSFTGSAGRLLQSTGSALQWLAMDSNIYRINVQSYGADPSGVADSSAAFISAIAALPASGGGLYIPRGIYKLSQKIIFPTKPLDISGDGPSASILKWTAAATTVGFEFNTAGINNHINIFNLCFVQDGGTQTDPLINITNTNTSSHINIIQNVLFGVMEAIAKSVYNCIRLQNQSMNIIENVTFWELRGIAIEIIGTADTIGSYSVEHLISNISVHSGSGNVGSYGIKATGWVEGVMLTNSNIVGPRIGVHANIHDNVGATSPQVFINNTHINANRIDIEIVQCSDLTVMNALLFCLSPYGQCVSTVSGGNRWRFVGVTFVGAGNGIYFTGTGANEPIMLVGCAFRTDAGAFYADYPGAQFLDSGCTYTAFIASAGVGVTPIEYTVMARAIADIFTLQCTLDTSVKFRMKNTAGTVVFSIKGSGQINVSGLPVYADNTAAAALLVGDMYKTATGEIRVRY